MVQCRLHGERNQRGYRVGRILFNSNFWVYPTNIIITIRRNRISPKRIRHRNNYWDADELDQRPRHFRRSESEIRSVLLIMETADAEGLSFCDLEMPVFRLELGWTIGMISLFGRETNVLACHGGCICDKTP